MSTSPQQGILTDASVSDRLVTASLITSLVFAFTVGQSTSLPDLVAQTAVLVEQRRPDMPEHARMREACTQWLLFPAKRSLPALPQAYLINCSAEPTGIMFPTCLEYLYALRNAAEGKLIFGAKHNLSNLHVILAERISASFMAK